jgi:uncharacterized protein YpuA (DUF1002 family)
LKSKSKDIKSVKDLERELDKLKRNKQKYLDMCTDEIITTTELKELTNNLNGQMRSLENQIEMKKFEIADEDTLNEDIRRKIQDIESVLNGDDFTNSGLKKVIDIVSANKDGNIEVRMQGLTEFKYDEQVIIRDIGEPAERKSY